MPSVSGRAYPAALPASAFSTPFSRSFCFDLLRERIFDSRPVLLRRLTTRPHLSLEDLVVSIVQSFQADLDHDCTPKQVRVLDLYLEGSRNREIAQLLGMEVNAVAATWVRIRARLARCPLLWNGLRP